MARSSGAGTGVIVALVVSVVCNFGLLTITFMLYKGKNDAIEEKVKVEARIADFATPSEANSEAFKRVLDAAKTDRKSLFAYLDARREAIATFVTGNRTAGLSEMQSGLGLQADDVAQTAMKDLRREVNEQNRKVASLETELADARTENKELRDRFDELRDSTDKRVAVVTEEFDGYTKAADRYEKEVEDAVTSIEESRARLERSYLEQINELQTSLDQANQDNSVFRAQIEELRRKTEGYRVKPQNPAELVDGRVVSVPGTGGQIFIDLGRNDRVVPGMTFEVYEDAAAIRADPRTNEYVRGKASIEIIRVGADTSAARITREISGRPVLKDDVIANAVFNPNYRFKFLVHGLFDVNNDGTPSVADADYVRRRVIEWGGELVEGQQLTGDLDFLVLGEQPPMPAPLPPDAGDAEFRSFLQQREAREVYDQLFDQASRAQIPVLNWNRFETLTGMSTR